MGVTMGRRVVSLKYKLFSLLLSSLSPPILSFYIASYFVSLLGLRIYRDPPASASLTLSGTLPS